MINRYAIVDATTHVVQNVTTVDSGITFDPGPGLLLFQTDTANIGDTRNGNGTFSPAAPPAAPVPISITSRQLFIAMARLGWITDSEAIAAANATAIPASILSVINTLPSDQQRDAKITFARMRDVERASPLVALAQGALGKTSAQADGMFILGASIS